MSHGKCCLQCGVHMIMGVTMGVFSQSHFTSTLSVLICTTRPQDKYRFSSPLCVSLKVAQTSSPTHHGSFLCGWCRFSTWLFNSCTAGPMVVGDSVIAHSKASCKSIRYLCPLGIVFTVSRTRNNETQRCNQPSNQGWFTHHMLQRNLPHQKVQKQKNPNSPTTTAPTICCSGP